MSSRFKIVVDDSLPPGTVKMVSGSQVVEVAHSKGVIACPACNWGKFIHIRGKLHCARCGRTIETCCD